MRVPVSRRGVKKARAEKSIAIDVPPDLFADMEHGRKEFAAASRAIDAQTNASREGYAAFERVPIEGAVELLTFDASNPVWKGDGPIVLQAAVKGAIVRLKPPPGIDSVRIQAVEAACREWGAIAVKRLPSRAAEVVPQDAKDALAPSRSAREVVSELVATASTKDRARLAVVVERALSKAGI